MEATGQLVLNPVKANLDLPEKTQEPYFNNSIVTHRKSFESTLDNIFRSDKEESQVQKARAILGDCVTDVSDEELSVYLTEFQYLLDGWLDSYEQQLFGGKTLQQLEREG